MYQKKFWDMIDFLRTLLILAANGNCTEIMKLLLERGGIDINAKDIYLFSSMFIFYI